MADSTLISSNFGAVVEIARKSGSGRNFTGFERGKALQVLWRANLIFQCCFAAHLYVYYYYYSVLLSERIYRNTRAVRFFTLNKHDSIQHTCN